MRSTLNGVKLICDWKDQDSQLVLQLDGMKWSDILL
jgi:hypothetical protein